MEDYEIGQHFWNFLTKPKSNASYEKNEVEGQAMEMQLHSTFEGARADEETIDKKDVRVNKVESDIDSHDSIAAYSYTTKTSYPYIEVPQGVTCEAYSCNASPEPKATDYSVIELPQDIAAYSYTTTQSDNPYTEVHRAPQHFPGYASFVEATEEGNWSAMKEFITCEPHLLTAPLFHNHGTALHLTLHLGKDREAIATCLVERMTPDDLELRDADDYTPLAIAALHHRSESLLKSMVAKNTNLPNIGNKRTIPILVASSKGFKDTTRFLYSVTHKNILSPEFEHGIMGVYLLYDCINIKSFDIASELVERFPKILLKPYKEPQQAEIYPMHAFAKTFSTAISGVNKKSTLGDYLLKFVCHLILDGSDEDKASSHDELIENEHARDFLHLACKHLSNVGILKLKKVVSGAMIEAAKHGNIEFINEMLKVDLELIDVYVDGKNMFWHAVESRQEKVFNLIYGVGDQKDSLLSYVNTEKGNNILHCAAKLPHSSILDRILGSSLQMQSELQWFKEVSNVAKTRYRGNLNNDKLTPRQFFTEQHKNLLKTAEESMKDTAKAATTVGALIITTIFSAAFAVAGTKNQIAPNISSYATELLFNIFVICDALSLCSSTAAILVFLGILTSRYSEEDFLFRLPRKFVVGFYALFIAIATMMAAFCSALATMVGGRLQLIMLLVLVLLFVPFMFAMSSICPLLCINCKSTYGPSIFDKSTKLPKSKRGNVKCCY